MPGKKEKKKIIPLHPVAENPDEDVLDDDPSFGKLLFNR
jgi:hypothetical protein